MYPRTIEVTQKAYQVSKDQQKKLNISPSKTETTKNLIHVNQYRTIGKSRPTLRTIKKKERKKNLTKKKKEKKKGKDKKEKITTKAVCVFHHSN